MIGILINTQNKLERESLNVAYRKEKLIDLNQLWNVPVLSAISRGFPLWTPGLPLYGNPSRVGSNDRDMMSAAERGLVKGIAECGKVFGLIGVISMCSVHDVSSDGRSKRSTSTLRVRCSKGTENVSWGILWSHERRLRSESLKPALPSNNL